MGRSFPRALAGPAVIALGVWCALGHVALAQPDDPSVRVVAAAHAWWLIAAFAAAMCVPGWRRHPLRATPAVLSTLPWWPIAWPSILLLWTGRLAWVPIGLAVWAAFGAGRDSAIAAPDDAAAAGAAIARRRPRTHAMLAALATLAAAMVTAWSIAPRVPGGDEPNYLVITQSLLEDGDLRIQNNFARHDYAAYYPGPLAPDYLQKGRDGEIYSIHAPGVPVLVLPAFAVFGYRGAQATIMLVAAAAGALIWLIGWLATRDRAAAWFAWAAIAGTTTFLVQAVTIFPDGPAVMIVAAAILLMLALDRAPAAVSAAMLAAAGALLAALPWLHTRFVVLAAGFGAAIVWRLVGDPTRGARARSARALACLAVPIASAIGWFAYFQIIYGTPNPSAPYGPDPGTRAAYVPGGIAGLLFDHAFGLFAYAPVLGIAALSLVGRRSRAPRVAAPMFQAAGVAVLYLAAAGMYWQWWAGTPAPPARFATAILPVFAAPLAIVWARSGRVERAAASLLLVATIAFSALLIGVDRGALAWNVRAAPVGWIAAIASVANVARLWPSFFWKLTPGDVRTERLFFAHVALGLGVCALTTLLLARCARRVAVRREARLAAAWWLALTIMAAGAAGWRLLGVSGVDASAAGIETVRAMAAGRPTFAIAPLSINRVPASNPFWVRVGRVALEAAGDEPAPWEALADVPAGRYAIRIVTKPAVAGTLSLRIGRSARPFAVIAVPAVSDQTLAFALPAGASGLAIEPDPSLSRAVRHLDLSPLTLAPGVRALAEQSLTLGAVQVLFLDDEVFPEDDGFWVRGGAAADIVLVAPDRAAVSLRLSNGTAANDVSIDAGSRRVAALLAPGATRVVTVPIAAGVARVRITSPAGFRPSDSGASADARDLGVRVTIADGDESGQ